MSYDTPAAAAPKKSKAKGCAGIGCLGVVAIVAVIGIASAMSSKSTPTASSTSPAAPAATSHTATGSSHAAAAAPAAAKPKTLLSLTGNGIKNSPQFTTGDTWTIKYSYDCTKIMGGQGNFSVYVDYPNGDIPVNELGAKGSSSSTASGAGQHTLKVASECPWTLTVTG